MQDEATLVVIKPDGLKKSLTGNILSRLAETRLKIIAARVLYVTRELAEKHYEHLGKEPFFPDLIRYIMGEMHGENRVMALVYFGPGAIGKVRQIAGATNPEKADPVTVRGAYGRILTTGLFENVMHASSSPDEAEREIKLWFEPEHLTCDLYPCIETVMKECRKKVWK